MRGKVRPKLYVKKKKHISTPHHCELNQPYHKTYSWQYYSGWFPSFSRSSSIQNLFSQPLWSLFGPKPRKPPKKTVNRDFEFLVLQNIDFKGLKMKAHHTFQIDISKINKYRNSYQFEIMNNFVLVCHVKYVKLYHLLFKTTNFQLLISIKSSIRAASRRPSDCVHPGSHDTPTKRKTRPTVQEKSCGNTYNPSCKLPMSYTHTQS